jgi:nitrogen-specific signal transduction histidine kinase
MSQGRVGETMRAYDEGHGSLAAIATYLEEVDPVLANLRPGDLETIDGVVLRLHDLQQELRLYTLRVVRADTAASAAVRDRIQASAQTTAVISVAAVLLSVLSLGLILRENLRQRDLVAMTQRIADEAELSSRAKSRFLSMMSHELRNPLNGVLGPLALLDQSELPERQTRLVEQAGQSARSMLRMLASLFDYAEMQDGRLKLDREAFRVETLAATLRDALAGGGQPALEITVAPGTPDRVEGDNDRLAQIFVHLAEFVLEMRAPDQVALVLSHDGANLVGELSFEAGDATVDWRLDLLTDLGDVAPDQVSADALRPLIARGLITAGRGELNLDQAHASRRLIRVTLPAPVVELDKVRVHLETRSAALATIYQAALRSDRVVFVEPGGDSPVDVVLVDSTSVGEGPLMLRLRQRFPDALFVSLGNPQIPDFFDDVVDTPGDMSSLRDSILNRLAS